MQAQTDKGQLPLLLSCHNKRVDIFEDLLDSNPDAVDGMDLQGNTCLHYSSKYCNPDCAKRVIEVNPDLSTQSTFVWGLGVRVRVSLLLYLLYTGVALIHGECCIRQAALGFFYHTL